MEPADNADQVLHVKREELAVEQLAVKDTLALLGRVEEQQRTNPEGNARWAKRALYLQDALEASRERIDTLENAIRQIEGRPGEGAAAAGSPAPAAAARSTEDALAGPRKAGAERVMGSPLFKLESLPLEDLAIARAFLATADSLAWPRDRREELRRRIAIYDRRAEREKLQSRPRMTADERRQQLLLRNVLDKCRAQAHATITLGEIDLLIHSCDLLLQHGASGDTDDRLFDLVNRAVDEVCRRWARLEAIRDALKPES